MEDLVDIDKALIALKKGTQLLKYGRKGKPKFTPFRLALSGQRTLVFQCFLLPEKDHLSFSLIYNDGKRSLDLICKDKVEAEVWFTGLNALISPGQHESQPQHMDGIYNGALSFECGRDSNLSSSSAYTTDSLENKLSSANSTKDRSSGEFTYSERTDVSDMQVKGASLDIRISVSSALSTSSHGSGGEDSESFGDVYIWGEVMCDTTSIQGSDSNAYSASATTDILVPKPLESNVMLDVSYVACGVKHAALVTRQAEVFTWGEECSGRLGHGAGTSIFQPHLVESLSVCNVETIACGEFHTCAISATGDLYTWGDGTHNAGLLGHGSNVSHWIPKRVSGPLEGLQVLAVSCGTWHTALITSSGKLYTFGDGTFGALGHGNRQTISCPKEVESLKGLRTICVSCGVWHTAAVVEVIMTQSNAVSSGKLFTWGDGDKYRLGHGDRSSKLKPTCVPSLIDYNFHKAACGHTLTIGLTTSGHIFTVGSSVYGQLGNPNNDGRYPRLVEEKLGGGGAVEIACGSYHVAVLTQNGQVYTWGKGANGRLGHGDIADRKAPTLVEALRDRSVKHVACGSGFTAAICQHKWVSGMEQSQCSSCRQPFGFTRKRHNCYNCGLVHCHSCSSKKALRAALSPNPGKPYRVCDSCYLKLSKVLDSVVSYNRNTTPRLPSDTKADMIKNLDVKAAKQTKKYDYPPQFPAILQLKDMSFIGDGQDADQQTVSTVTNRYPNDPAFLSPFVRMPNLTSCSLSSESFDNLRDANELLKQEFQKLKEEVNSLRQQCEQQGADLQKSEAKAHEAMILAAEEASKSKAAMEAIRSLTAQLKEMAERLPPASCDMKQARQTYLPGGAVSPETGRESQKRYQPSSFQYPQTPASVASARFNGFLAQAHQISEPNATTMVPQGSRYENNGNTKEFPAVLLFRTQN
ncbi:hypothetical protein GUJ93_ZPchr0458g22335 [Zizania palustris]|uniref:FYVE-type domain-containing protein n=1 Tax=Zizania palustris TaxID=103762 RepID=A0A8J5VEB1_ZIZPA|nr:hypothetical protein GUJ93_ZPchr0458g22335 [Zizania palustris]